ncbi:hypothetical protein NTD84_23045 [Pseudomonas sp. 14P_8.1_Bac3]|uniref:hypothetical protein n=1 Tax=Pseudomonas sp. 14P_8.1_Bac3 TaxID=2971621 RepID=UPI0021C7DF99|nr:hypothetical protein [Pseudomonas sp. 14P_8.1_Bac3]MCU1762579.1 hypothetical protein [Pseudomonas sp. 14P_8.1_Bac3]
MNIKDLFTGPARAIAASIATEVREGLELLQRGSFKAGLRGWPRLENAKAPPGVMPGGAFFQRLRERYYSSGIE